MSSVLAWPNWSLAPLAARAEPSFLVTACQTKEHAGPREGSVPVGPRSTWSLPTGFCGRGGSPMQWWQLCAHPVGAQWALICPKELEQMEHLVQTDLLGDAQPPPATQVMAINLRCTRERADSRQQAVGSCPLASWSTGSGGTLGLGARRQHMPSLEDGGVVATLPCPPRKLPSAHPSSLRCL